MELGKDVSTHFRAKNFLGFLSIRNGIFAISFSQLLFGVALYCILHYLHPSLTGVAVFMLVLHVLVAGFGFVGALKRKLGLHVVYMILYAVSMVFVLMIALDMSELLHFLPKAPQMHDLAMFTFAAPLITRFKMPNASVLFPFSFYKESLLSDAHAQHRPVYRLGTGRLPAKFSVNEVDLHTHKCCGNPLMSYKSASKLAGAPFDASDPNGTMDLDVDDLNRLKQALRDRLRDASPVGNDASRTPQIPDSSTSPPSPVVAETKQPEKADNSDSLYDSIPFLPHPGETEGESEEVSKDEFPPETKELSPEAKSEVVVMYKMQKRSLKFASAAFLMLALLFYLYSYWIALTFAMNKCTCLDELSAHPDQFSPLID